MTGTPLGLVELVTIAANANPIGGDVLPMCSGVTNVTSADVLPVSTFVETAPPLYTRCRDYRKCARHNYRARRRGAPGKISWHRWRRLRHAFGNCCAKCGASGEVEPLTLDHITPLSLGGANDISNVQPLCKACNDAKGATIADYRNGVTWRRGSYDFAGLVVELEAVSLSGGTQCKS